MVAVAASAGGLTAIRSLLSILPNDLHAAVLVVMHLLPEHRSRLAEVLRRETELHVKTADSRDTLEPGWVYVAPPDAHLLLDLDGRLQLDTGPPVNYVRPSADVLLESLAASCNGNCLAVVLTGTGSDGASGARAVKDAGGTVIVQDPASAEYAGMPQSAIATGAADAVLPLAGIADAITAFVAHRQRR